MNTPEAADGNGANERKETSPLGIVCDLVASVQPPSSTVLNLIHFLRSI